MAHNKHLPDDFKGKYLFLKVSHVNSAKDIIGMYGNSSENVNIGFHQRLLLQPLTGIMLHQHETNPHDVIAIFYNVVKVRFKLN